MKIPSMGTSGPNGRVLSTGTTGGYCSIPHHTQNHGIASSVVRDVVPRFISPSMYRPHDEAETDNRPSGLFTDCGEVPERGLFMSKIREVVPISVLTAC